MSAARRGFTLLEVLASIAILGIVYTILAGVAARWLAAEGEARRRMQAALLADRALAEIEAQVVAGNVPPAGENEWQDESQLYHIATKISDLVVPPDLAALPERKLPENAPTLFPTTSGAPSYLRRIDVVVGWEESGQPFEIRRTTAAFDIQAAALILAAIPGPEDEVGGGEAGGEGAGSERGEEGEEGARQGQRGMRPGAAAQRAQPRSEETLGEATARSRRTAVETSHGEEQ